MPRSVIPHSPSADFEEGAVSCLQLDFNFFPVILYGAKRSILSDDGSIRTLASQVNLAEVGSTSKVIPINRSLFMVDYKVT